jgi:hypothetical protein
MNISNTASNHVNNSISSIAGGIKERLEELEGIKGLLTEHEYLAKRHDILTQI